jgi:hypothetical protein
LTDEKSKIEDGYIWMIFFTKISICTISKEYRESLGVALSKHEGSLANELVLTKAWRNFSK